MVSPIYQRNIDIRNARGKMPLWIIAEKLGVHENTLRLWLRKELPAEKKATILTVIDQVKKEFNND